MPRTTVLAVITVLALLTACSAPSDVEDQGVASLGGDQDATPVDAPEGALSDPLEAALAFTSCMREHGIDLPDPEVADDGGILMTIDARGSADHDSAAFGAAQEECQPLLDGVGGNAAAAQVDPAQQQQMLDFARCMRDQGVDWPDPEFDGNGASIQSFPHDDSGAVEAAMGTCSQDVGTTVPAAPAQEGS